MSNDDEYLKIKRNGIKTIQIYYRKKKKHSRTHNTGNTGWFPTSVLLYKIVKKFKVFKVRRNMKAQRWDVITTKYKAREWQS